VSFDFLYKFFRNICHSKNHWRRNDKKYLAIFMKSARNSCAILIKLEFSRQFFSKNTQIWTFKKIRQVEDELFHADRRTDMTKLIVALHNFVNAPKNVSNVPPAPKSWQRCVIELGYCSQVDQLKKRLSAISFRLSPRPLHTPLMSCFLISSKCVPIKIRLKSEGNPSI
jgi:hypothetical protein